MVANLFTENDVISTFIGILSKFTLYEYFFAPFVLEMENRFIQSSVIFFFGRLESESENN